VLTVPYSGWGPGPAATPFFKVSYVPPYQSLMSILYIVSTPIGHLGDMTFRGVEVLSAVDRVLAEDTRRTSILFRRYEIDTPLVSAHAHNEEARTRNVLDWLEAGETLALVSDAGTPLLSDPGARLVRSVVEAGHDVVPVPGASALLAALVASGLEPEPFTFHGFPPRSGSARRELLGRVAELEHTAVFYEAPGRLTRLLADLIEYCGADRRVAVAREVTKMHETFVRGTLAEALDYYGKGQVRGEVVVVLGGGTGPVAAADAVDPEALARSLLEGGMRPSAVARELSSRLGMPRNDAYAIALALAAPREGDAD
jgi:16S rRNA (cytidine1402-2'-O)-methyltransferase